MHASSSRTSLMHANVDDRHRGRVPSGASHSFHSFVKSTEGSAPSLNGFLNASATLKVFPYSRLGKVPFEKSLQVEEKTVSTPRSSKVSSCRGQFADIVKYMFIPRCKLKRSSTQRVPSRSLLATGLSSRQLSHRKSQVSSFKTYTIRGQGL